VIRRILLRTSTCECPHFPSLVPTLGFQIALFLSSSLTMSLMLPQSHKLVFSQHDFLLVSFYSQPVFISFLMDSFSSPPPVTVAPSKTSKDDFVRRDPCLKFLAALFPVPLCSGTCFLFFGIWYTVFEIRSWRSRFS